MALYQLSRSFSKIRLGKKILDWLFIHSKVRKEQEWVWSVADIDASQQDSNSFIFEYFEPNPTA